ncbi:MAG: amidohydrolase family protein, partial [Candidatus Heimdallarchaeota archaeon]|nr:amidohydrolase family protein [Candidatus Heimdallarchaeota archaeon]
GMPPPKKIPSNFVEILNEVWWKLDLALDEESTKVSFEAGLLECLRSGVTTVFDHHSSPNFTNGSLLLLSNIAEKFGQNISVAFESTDRNGKENFKLGLQENIDSLNKFKDNPYVYPLLGLHASFTLSDESLQAIYSKLKELDGWGIHIHVAEDKADENDAQSKGYESVIDRLNKFKLINEHSFIIHGIHSSDKDMELLKNAGATLVHNPTSNANNRVGMLPNSHISTMNAGLGTDGMRANMLDEAQQGTLIRSSHLQGAESSIDYLELLFKNNPEIASRAIGRQIGHLSPGNQADLAIYDYQPQTTITEDNFAGHILFGFGAPEDVITRGKYRIKNRKFVVASERKIKENANLQSQKLWNKMKTL